MRGLRSVLANRLYLSALGVFMVFVVGVAYLFAAVLDQPLTSRPIVVTVELTNAGGLFEGSAVTYRGVKVGKVTSITISDTGVEAELRLASDTQVPKDTIAKVRSLSPVGEQYLDFQPTSDRGPFLDDGARITAASTDLPKSLSSTVVALSKLLQQVDDRKLRTLLVELSNGLSGTGDEIGRLVDQGDLILAKLDEVYPQTDRLITNSDIALDIATDSSGDIRDLAASSRQLAAFLRDYDPELRRTLRRTPAQLRELEALVADAQEVLPDFLSVGVSFTDIFAAHDPHLRELFRSYAPGLGVLTEVIRDGELKLELISDRDPRCRYVTTRRDPRDTERRALQVDGRCSASFSTLQRGAAQAPGPVR